MRRIGVVMPFAKGDSNGGASVSWRCPGRRSLMKLTRQLRYTSSREGNVGDDIHAKMRSHCPLQPKTPVQFAKYEACGPV